VSDLIVKSPCIHVEGKDGSTYVTCYHDDDERVAARMAAETIAAQQAELRRLESKLAALTLEVLDVLNNLEDRADVTDGPDGRPAPGWTMSLANTLRDALTAARR